jgi:hypothetical protein
MNITKTIAGHEITLEAGERYIATRPMAHRGRQVFPVSIKVNNSNVVHNRPLVTIPGLSYDQANEFQRAFNNGPTSFDGRVW